MATALRADAAVSRNAICPCGSRKRFRECCGAFSFDHSETVESIDSIANQSLLLHQKGALDAAKRGYERVLTRAPDHFNAAHMLGVVALQQRRPSDAVRLLLDAGRMVGWHDAGVCHNARLALRDAVHEHERPGSLDERRARVEAMRAERLAARSATPRFETPLVSVLLPSYRHPQFIEMALRSVYAQSWQQVELIVIDDGSPDDSPQRIQRLLAECPFPHRFVARENRGAHATINEALAMARGDYVNVLNSDDAFTEDRLERCIDGVHRAGARWGFGRCNVIDERGVEISSIAPAALSFHALMNAAATAERASECFLEGNPAISSGNIFVETALARQIGGFAALRYNHDWNFCLEALQRDEPAMIEEPLYLYRVHGGNTIAEDRINARREADRIIELYLRNTTAPARPENPLALCEAMDRWLWMSSWLLPGTSNDAFGERAERLAAWVDEARSNHRQSPLRAL